METIIKKQLTLTLETSSGGVLNETFNNYAELFDFVTQCVMGNSAYDKDIETMIQHVDNQWSERGNHGNPWDRKGFQYRARS